MFSGIIETTTTVRNHFTEQIPSKLILNKPQDFTDLKIGESISVNGVCLTVEEFDNQTFQFAIGPETLKITQWDQILIANSKVNLERSLKLGDRIHGHLVSGHVDTQGEVTRISKIGESLLLSIKLPREGLQFVWKKGSIAIQGVSLTVNELMDSTVEVCLIPETLRRTNLVDLNLEDKVTIEYDYYAKGLLRAKEIQL